MYFDENNKYHPLHDYILSLISNSELYSKKDRKKASTFWNKKNDKSCARRNEIGDQLKSIKQWNCHQKVQEKVAWSCKHAKEYMSPVLSYSTSVYNMASTKSFVPFLALRCRWYNFPPTSHSDRYKWRARKKLVWPTLNGETWCYNWQHFCRLVFKSPNFSTGIRGHLS